MVCSDLDAAEQLGVLAPAVVRVERVSGVGAKCGQTQAVAAAHRDCIAGDKGGSLDVDTVIFDVVVSIGFDGIVRDGAAGGEEDAVIAVLRHRVPAYSAGETKVDAGRLVLTDRVAVDVAPVAGKNADVSVSDHCIRADRGGARGGEPPSAVRLCVTPTHGAGINLNAHTAVAQHAQTLDACGAPEELDPVIPKAADRAVPHRHTGAGGGEDPFSRSP